MPASLMNDLGPVAALAGAATCRICGGLTDAPPYRVREMLYGSREPFDYFECGDCGCVQIAKIPADLSRFYPPGYFSFRDYRALDRNWVRRFIDPRRVRRSFGRRDWLGALAESVSRPFDYVDWVRQAGLTMEARVLDVGCGAGKTLINMALGGFPAPTGVDPFIAETLRYSCGVTIHKSRLEEFARERPAAFDLIMFHSSLEHVPDPAGDLRLAEAMLAPGGRLLVTVPVADSWAWEHYRADWFALDPPRHLHVFTRAAMDILAAGAGLKVLSARSVGEPAQVAYSERYRRDIPASDPRRDGDLFSRAELAAWRRLAEDANRQQRGDQTMFILGRPSEVSGI
jgi:SAM-dependent methyltransferase